MPAARLQRTEVGGANQLRVRHRAPQEERQPRRDVFIGEPEVGVADAGRLLFEPEQEARAHQDRLRRQANAGFEAALLASLVVELHRVLEVGGGRRAAKRLRRQPLHDLGRARFLFSLRGRAAREDLQAARRVRHAGDIERPLHDEVAQVRQHGDAPRDADVGQRVLERHQQVVDRAVELLHERGGDALRAGLDVHGRRHQLEAVLRIGLAHPRVEIDQRDALAVDGELDLLFEVVGRHRVAAGQAAERLVMQRRLQHVMAVGRERMHDRRAAARAHRRAIDAAHLRRRARNLVGDRRRRGVAIANGQAADLARRTEVAVHQRRREALRVGDVVEAVADRVGRQERRHIDVDVQQVADRVLVFGAIEALERTRARIRVERRELVHPRLERRRPCAWITAGSGRRAPGGGIMPARSFRIIFSVSSPFSSIFAASKTRERDAAGAPCRARYGRSRSTA